MYLFCAVPAILGERKSTSNLASLVCRSASELIIVDFWWHNIKLLLMIVCIVFQLCRSLFEDRAASALTVARPTLL